MGGSQNFVAWDGTAQEVNTQAMVAGSDGTVLLAGHIDNSGYYADAEASMGPTDFLVVSLVASPEIAGSASEDSFEDGSEEILEESSEDSEESSEESPEEDSEDSEETFEDSIQDSSEDSSSGVEVSPTVAWVLLAAGFAALVAL